MAVACLVVAGRSAGDADGGTGTDTAIVTVNVTAAQDPPTANADSFSTAEDTPVVMTVASLLANDTDPDGPSPSMLSAASCRMPLVSCSTNAITM